jgi:RNA polymerase sigma-70 factor, ECF subfamily
VTDTQQLHAWIEGCLKGDRRSQQAIHKLYYGRMKVVCMRYTRDTDQAEDVLQEGFIKVFQQLEKYSGLGSFEGWVRRIMVNLAIDRFRKLKHDFVSVDDDRRWELAQPSEEDEDETDGSAYADITPEQIIDAMQQLTPAYRTVFNLYVYEDYNHQQIAEALGISVGTSKSNYAKAKKNMRKLLTRNKDIQTK